MTDKLNGWYYLNSADHSKLFRIHFLDNMIHNEDGPAWIVGDLHYYYLYDRLQYIRSDLEWELKVKESKKHKRNGKKILLYVRFSPDYTLEPINDQ